MMPITYHLSPITYLLYLDDDAIPLESSSTVGNHLEAMLWYREKMLLTFICELK